VILMGPLVVLLEIIFNQIFGRQFDFTKSSLWHHEEIAEERYDRPHLSERFQKEIIIDSHALPLLIYLLGATRTESQDQRPRDREIQTMW
jgi:hypothetical protein